MCGITGYIDNKGESSEDVLLSVVKRMSSAIRHRGPDGDGAWVDSECGVAFGHRRLSIIDLSAAGKQPMFSHCGRYVTVYNGEIYNFQELRRELESDPAADLTFRGHSDTEVMLAVISRFGIEAALKQFRGMFALAIWDRKDRTLTLARDRVGEKPLYYGWQGNALLFGSELKSLRVHPQFKNEIDRNALCLLLRHNYIPAPHSIYKNIYKLPPGSFLTIRADAAQNLDSFLAFPREGVADGGWGPQFYWSLRETTEQGLAEPFRGSPDEAVAELKELLLGSTREQMMSDVPLGAFLSGGVDSSLVAALMQAQSSQPIQTFSIGFEDAAFNEAPYAKAVAAHLGTAHTELYVTPADALEVIPRLPEIYDEPFSDSSQIPTTLLSQLTRKHVTVSLSGDGGDELFCGYTRYYTTDHIWKRRWLMSPGRWALLKTLKIMPAGLINGLSRPVMPFLKRFMHPQLPMSENLKRLTDMLAFQDREDLYRQLLSHWRDPASLVINGEEASSALTDPFRKLNLKNYKNYMMYLDMASYLPDDILVKVDRAGMASSLESRIPLLDHRVMEFAWRLPLSFKARGGQSKWILRQLLNQYVPRGLIERPKMGFGVPVGDWLSGSLREWAEDLLDETKMREQGFFHPEPIRKCWADHVNGVQNHQYEIWDVLMFQAWRQANV